MRRIESEQGWECPPAEQEALAAQGEAPFGKLPRNDLCGAGRRSSGSAKPNRDHDQACDPAKSLISDRVGAVPVVAVSPGCRLESPPITKAATFPPAASDRSAVDRSTPEWGSVRLWSSMPYPCKLLGWQKL